MPGSSGVRPGKRGSAFKMGPGRVLKLAQLCGQLIVTLFLPASGYWGSGAGWEQVVSGWEHVSSVMIY